MDNFQNTNKARRYKAHVSIFGTTQIHLRNPWTIAMWSVAFPGFGHFLLNKYFRGCALFIWEVYINQTTKLNQAIVFSFIGNFEAAKEVLDLRMVLLYAPVYLFAIWDSYRTTVDMNNIYTLAKREDAQFNSFAIGAFEINYLDKRNPLMAIFWAMTIPSIGQLYVHRIILAGFTLIWTAIFIYNSHFLEAFIYLLNGNLAKSNEVLDAQWLLYLPTFYFFTIYDSYISAIENNKLFEDEQRKYLRSHYQNYIFNLMKVSKVTNMQIFATFEHSTYLELAITELEEHGIKNILAIPLNNRLEERKLFDNLHQSDGVSLISKGMILAFLFSTVGASRGFILEWGPIIWGLIGAGSGFVIGFVIDLFIKKVVKRKQRLLRGKNSEVILIVECEQRQKKHVESILWNQLALGVAELNQTT
ncbi:hypothetical protein [Bacillus sp. PS06]|uniref:hypothetical protein n=1 Tax=Bacillus sp. PS06 TaxID=2764176 RepID=UPI00296ED5AB|nr:hypothetical protein [Bacillus sp. PS06]